MSAVLDGRRVVVTGASRGIGRALALGLADAGAELVLVARDAAALDEVASLVRERGASADVVPADLSDLSSIPELAATVLSAGEVDVLVNNAGGISFSSDVLDLRPGGWEKVFRLNVDATVEMCRAFGRPMVERRSGSVINVASVAAFSAMQGIAPYGAAKAAVVSLTKSLAVEWGASGVRVNALCPGWVATDLTAHMWSHPETSAAMVATIPLGRWAQPDEMVGPTVFLASDASSYMTGQTLTVDGGLSAH
jgi:NAD(P)-dependent dehydrogenase (short-subunit alcohol dehydrogenase family)